MFQHLYEDLVRREVERLRRKEQKRLKKEADVHREAQQLEAAKIAIAKLYHQSSDLQPLEKYVAGAIVR